MAREISKQMHEEFKRWLEHKGLNPNDVLTNYVIHSEGGFTQITITMFANDFPVPPMGEKNTQEPCDTCDSTAGGCAECHNETPSV